jgi:hypothetical protein
MDGDAYPQLVNFCKTLLKKYNNGINKKYLNINVMADDMAQDIDIVLEKDVNNDLCIAEIISKAEIYKYFMPYYNSFDGIDEVQNILENQKDNILDEMESKFKKFFINVKKSESSDDE